MYGHHPKLDQLKMTNGYFSLSPFAPENLVSRDGFGRPVPRQPAPYLHSGRIWCFRTRFLPPSVTASIYLYSTVNRNRVTPQFYQATQLRTDGVHCRESTGAGPVVLKGVPVTCAAFWGIIIIHFLCASLFPHPLFSTVDYACIVIMHV